MHAVGAFLAQVTRERRLSYRALSLAAGLNASAVSEIVRTGRARGETLRRLAGVLDLPPQQLFALAFIDEEATDANPTPQGASPSPPGIPPAMAVPVAPRAGGVESPATEYVYLPAARAGGRSLLALRVSEDSLSPHVEPDDIVIVETGTAIRPGDIVVVDLADVPLVRRLEVRGGQHVLVANGSEAAPIALAEDHLVGVVIEIHRTLWDSLGI